MLPWGFKLNLKNIEWKRFLLEKGEKVGLCVAGLVGLAFLVMCLVTALFATGPGENANKLKQQAETVQNRLNSSQPGPQDKPLKPDDPLPPLAQFKVEHPEKFWMASLFTVTPPGDSNRRQPEVLQPDEGKVIPVMAQIKVYQIRADNDTYMAKVLDITGMKDAGGSQQAMQRLGGMRGGMERRMAAWGMAAGPQFTSPGHGRRGMPEKPS